AADADPTPESRQNPWVSRQCTIALDFSKRAIYAATPEYLQHQNAGLKFKPFARSSIWQEQRITTPKIRVRVPSGELSNSHCLLSQNPNQKRTKWRTTRRTPNRTASQLFPVSRTHQRASAVLLRKLTL